MAFVTSELLLINAQKAGYAIPAFNIENMEMAMAVIEAACEENSPVIIQTTSSTIKYAGAAMYRAITLSLARSCDIPVALHLDHGDSFERVLTAIMNGYTSVMIDGSLMSFNENIAITKKVVEAAHILNIPVEAELGKVGGKEDDTDAGNTDDKTDPGQALEFVTQTGIDSLAVAIGTAHGLYKGTPKIDIERLREIRKIVDIPLVLHGATGVGEDVVTECIKNGICKVNFATELRIAFSDGVKETFNNEPGIFDPKIPGRAGMAKVKAVVRKNIHICGSAGRV